MRVRRLGRRRGNVRRIGLHDLHMADGADRRAVAGAHAWRAHHAHIRAELFRQFGKQPLGAGSAQDSESHTRTVTGGGGVSPSFTTSKWA